MKNLVFLAVALGLGLTCPGGTGRAQTAPATPAETKDAPAHACADCLDCHGDEGEALRKLEQEWAEAVVHNDAEEIGRIEAEEFICTDPDGVVTHREDDLKAAKAGALTISDLKIEDIKVSVYGETAVVTGKSTFKGTAYGRPIDGSYRWTDVFVKRDNRWQVVASQATTIAPPSGA